MVEQLPETTESVSHMLSCPATSSRDLWAQSLEDLEIFLSSQLTDPVLTNMILSGLRTWLDPAYPAPPLQQPYLDLWVLQQETGWQSLLEGRAVVGWASMQDAYFRTRELAISRTGLRWLMSVLRQMMDIAWDQWEHRNGILHNITTGARHQELIQQVRQEFILGNENSPVLARLLRPGLITITKRSPQQLEQWLAVVTVQRDMAQPNRSILAQRALLRNFLSPPLPRT